MQHTRLMSVLTAAVLVTVGGCVESDEDLTVNPDGSGKVAIDARITMMQMTADSDLDRVAKRAAAAILEQSEGVTAWRDVSYDVADDGRLHFRGTAYFKNLGAVKFQNLGVPQFTWSHRDGQGVLQARLETKRTEGPEKAGAEMTEKEVEAQVAQARRQWQMQKPVMQAFLGGFQATATVHLPGRVTETTGFEKVEGGKAVRLSLKGEKMLAELNRLMQDDGAVRRMVRAGTTPTGPSETPPPELLRAVFGSEGAPKAVVKDLQPQFDYAAELKTAQAASGAMLERLGLSTAAPKPTARGEGFKWLRVGGVRLVFWEGVDQARPFGQKVGYTLGLVGQLEKPVLDSREIHLTKAVADTGDDLLPRYPRSWAHVREDKKTLTFEVQLEMPGPEVQMITELAGVLVYRVAGGEKKVDLGLKELKAGAKGKAFGAVIEEVGPGRDRLKMRYDDPPEEIREVRLYNEEGVRLDIHARSTMRGPDEMEVTYHTDDGFPERGRIVLVLYEGLQSFEAPFELEDIPVVHWPKKPGPAGGKEETK